jgi:crossover junction endodeoxyribonuclease RusA
MAEYRILLRGVPLLSANQRQHWARRNRTAQAIKSGAGWLARQQRIPRLARVEITGVYHPARAGRHDGENWAPTCKAATDGLRDARVIADDDSTHVVSTTLTIGEPMPGGAYELIVREVS